MVGETLQMGTAKQTWILAGYEIFAQEGAHALQVEALARKVQKSKSSFYHYFVDLDIFTDALLDYHIQQAKALAYQLKQCKTFADVIPVLLQAKHALFFSKQLLINRDILIFRQCCGKVGEIIEPIFVPLWAEALGLERQTHLAEDMLDFVSENFYLQITEETFTHDWFTKFLGEIRRLVQNIHQAKSIKN